MTAQRRRRLHVTPGLTWGSKTLSVSSARKKLTTKSRDASVDAGSTLASLAWKRHT
jgi:hypothetical protein